MSRNIDLLPGDVLTGKVLIFDLNYNSSIDGGTTKVAMTAKVSCEGITVEQLKNLMKGQGLVVRSQNNRERKLGTRLLSQTHFDGDWKDFTKSSGAVIDVSSMTPKDLTDRMTKEQMQAVYVEMNRRLNAGEPTDTSLEELATAADDESDDAVHEIGVDYETEETE